MPEDFALIDFLLELHNTGLQLAFEDRHRFHSHFAMKISFMVSPNVMGQYRGSF